MEAITCVTTLSNLHWPPGYAWHVSDGEKNTLSRPLEGSKRAWIRSQGLESTCMETMGGWSFRNKEDAIEFMLAWS